MWNRTQSLSGEGHFSVLDVPEAHHIALEMITRLQKLKLNYSDTNFKTSSWKREVRQALTI